MSNSVVDTSSSHDEHQIVVLTAGGVFAEVIINVLAARFGSLTVIQEEREPFSEIFRRWCRLRGIRRALGQAAFIPLQRLAALHARGRRAEILSDAKLDATPNLTLPRLKVISINSDACRTALQHLEPRIVLVVGTRMIRKQILSSTNAIFINYHAGINPRYRGQYGGYWALAQGDASHAGVTVHLVDAGVDTGSPLYFARFAPGERDNVATFHYLQVVVAIPLIMRAMDDALSNRLTVQAYDGPSQQWFHPTAVEYLRNGLRRSVW
jgi:folate-dependent phosphoribosylglycinamide formyltransferase PurN